MHKIISMYRFWTIGHQSCKQILEGKNTLVAEHCVLSDTCERLHAWRLSENQYGVKITCFSSFKDSQHTNLLSTEKILVGKNRLPPRLYAVHTLKTGGLILICSTKEFA